MDSYDASYISRYGVPQKPIITIGETPAGRVLDTLGKPKLSAAAEAALSEARSIENVKPQISRKGIDKSLGIGHRVKSAEKSADVFIKNGFGPVTENAAGTAGTTVRAVAPKAPLLKKIRKIDVIAKRTLKQAKGKFAPAAKGGADAAKTTMLSKLGSGVGKAGKFVKQHKVAAAVVAGLAAITAIACASQKEKKPYPAALKNSSGQIPFYNYNYGYSTYSPAYQDFGLY